MAEILTIDLSEGQPLREMRAVAAFRKVERGSDDNAHQIGDEWYVPTRFGAGNQVLFYINEQFTPMMRVEGLKHIGLVNVPVDPSNPFDHAGIIKGLEILAQRSSGKRDMLKDVAAYIVDPLMPQREIILSQVLVPLYGRQDPTDLPVRQR